MGAEDLLVQIISVVSGVRGSPQLTDTWPWGE
jgi:hypothetical protein